jgi:hypothetical protein
VGGRWWFLHLEENDGGSEASAGSGCLTWLIDFVGVVWISV